MMKFIGKLQFTKISRKDVCLGGGEYINIVLCELPKKELQTGRAKKHMVVKSK